MRTFIAVAALALTIVFASPAAIAQRGPTPSCLTRHGAFAWNCAGPIPGMACTQILEAADPHTWQDNWFCAERDIGARWSSAGPIPGMACTQILEVADTHTWQDNYLCVPPQSGYHFRWNSAGPIASMDCLQWDEPADPDTWNDNYLCWDRTVAYATAPTGGVECVNASGPFAWSCRGPIAGMACTQITEDADPDTWNDNFFCAAQDFGIRWSSAGPIPGMRCTQTLEAADPHTWGDNYICVPPHAPWRFMWNSAGRVPGATCVQWLEPSDPHTWSDNFLCW